VGYTLSFDASLKVNRQDVRGYLHHTARDVDRQNGHEVHHSNELIDPARTATNETWVSDGAGGWRRCQDTAELVAAMDARLVEVKKPLRKDAVVLRPLILQLDPEWYAAHQSESDRMLAVNDMMVWASETFGGQNVIGWSRHKDESNEHLHVLVCPVTDDGRLSQKDWFCGPAALRQMHQDFREHMTDQGYDMEMGRKKPGKYARRMDEREYKDAQELARMQKDLEAQEAALKARERALDAREAQVRRDGQKAAERLAEAEEAISEAEAVKARALVVLDRCDRWLDGKAEDSGIIDYAKHVKNKAGVSMWDRYQEQVKPTRATLARARQTVDGLTVPSIPDQIEAQRQRAGAVRPAPKKLTQKEASAGLEL